MVTRKGDWVTERSGRVDRFKDAGGPGISCEGMWVAERSNGGDSADAAGLSIPLRGGVTGTS